MEKIYKNRIKKLCLFFKNSLLSDEKDILHNLFYDNAKLPCVIKFERHSSYYCVECDKFLKESPMKDHRGIMDRMENIHCCSDCGKCHDRLSAFFCGQCNSCHPGNPHLIDISYVDCPKCDNCVLISNHEKYCVCNKCGSEFIMDDF